MKLWFLIILLFILVAGCISSEVQAGAPGQYELPGIDNTTIYYLNASTVKVVDSASNETTIKYMLDDSSETNFRDPVAVNSSGKNVSFNFWKKLYKVRFQFRIFRICGFYPVRWSGFY